MLRSSSPSAAWTSITSPSTGGVQRFTPEFIEAARPRRPCPGDRWFVDETYVKVAGRWTYLYRAIDQHGQGRQHLAVRQARPDGGARLL
jgi:transposase-like protein